MKASVIVLAWNGREYLETCLNAVFAQDYPDFEVIVVDNGSTDGSADFVAERFPRARLIRNERNLGFAAGNNVGLRAATGDVLVLLNQDTEVRPGWLAALVAGLQQTGAGMVGSKAHYPDGRIQHAGGYVNERGEGAHYGRGETDQGQYDVARAVDFVTGASLALSRRVYEIIGDLDAGFAPAYYEDVDWCYRARAAGFEVVYLPQSVLVHKELSMAASMDHEGMYIFHRSRLRFILKHWSLERLSNEFVPAERGWLESIDEGGERLIAALHHAYLYHLLHLADIMDWRYKLLGASPDETDTLAALLTTLRAITPLKPARLPSRSTMAAPAGNISDAPALAHPVPSARPATGEISPAVYVSDAPALATLLPELRQKWEIREHEFRSDVPVLGRLIAAFRRQWNRISTEWYVKPVIQQQTEFNALVLAVLEQFSARFNQLINQLSAQFNQLSAQFNQLSAQFNQQESDRQRLGEVLAEYISENGREVAELTREIRRLNIVLETIDQRK